MSKKSILTTQFIGSLLLLLCLLLTSNIQAQSWDAGIGMSGLAYQGDLAAKKLPTLKGIQPGARLFVRRNLPSERWALRLNAQVGRLKGDDAFFNNRPWTKDRGFSFSSPFAELAGLLQYQLVSSYTKNYTPRRVLPYFVAGVGGAYINPTVDFNETEQIVASFDDIRQDKANKKNLILTLPIGLGFKVPVSSNSIIGIEGTWHMTMTDYLDGISVTGNPGSNDHFLAMGVHYVFRFGAAERIDSDKDGVPDIYDDCPVVVGTVKNNGCPEDNDGDGVLDKNDRCPELIGTSINGGCPSISPTDQAEIKNLAVAMHFDLQQTDLNANTQQALDKAMQILDRYPYYELTIIAYANPQGDQAANESYAKACAKKCAEYLKSKGWDIDKVQYETVLDLKSNSGTDPITYFQLKTTVR